MTTIESSKLLLMRVQKAVGLIRHLRDENKELLARFTLVENHNKELQDLYDKLSTDQAAIDQAIASALEELDTSLGDLEGFEDFGTLDSEELSEAEDFSAGLDTEDIETSYISAYPEYQWKDDERILIGQRVSQSIEVKLHDIDAIGDVYTRLMSIDGISLSDVTLDKEDKSEEYREARMEAVHDAYEKASAFAEAAGVKVGSVISISDNSSYASPIYRSANMMLAAADSTAKVSAPTEFYSQEITVSATVSVVYGIDQ